MNMNVKKISAKIFVISLFILLEFILLNFDLIKIIGVDNASFTAAAAFAPAIGGIIGRAAFFVIILANTTFALINGSLFGKAFLVILVYMGVPLACASLYFGGRNRGVILIPLVCMLAFWLHPIGSQVWYFPILWLIPIVIRFIPKTKKISLVLNGIGTAFVDHAVGSVLYLYAINIPVAAWQLAFPIAIFERITFGLGIAVSYGILKYITLSVENALSKAFGWDLCVSKLFGMEQSYPETS